MSGLGRRVPTDWRHVERYPLRNLAESERPANVPVPIGINWYAEFDHPTRGDDGRWRVATDGNLTRIRGGHCVCLKPAARTDNVAWWSFYDQGAEGSCVGYGVSRAMTLLNRRRYDARWLYGQAQLADEWDDTPPEEGTSVRAGLDILTRGHRRVYAGHIGPVVPGDGIAVYRWATSVDDVLATLGMPGGNEVPFLNSWGRDYPHLTYVPAGVLARLLREDGEFAVITDR